MGCGTSKLDDLPAVALCKGRCSSLDEAISLRYSLSDSHHSYFRSLSSLSPSFLSFFPPLPHPLPSKPPPPTTTSSSAALPPRSSRSGSHIDFDDSDDSDDDLHHDSGDLSPLRLYHHDGLPAVAPQRFPNDYEVPAGMGGFFGQGGGFFNMNYMRNKASTPSVIYEQQPISYQTVQFGEASSSSSSSAMPPPVQYPPYPYQSNASSYPGNAVIGGGEGGGGVIYPNYGYPGYGNSAIGGGYYANSPPRQSYSTQAKPPPPPPSPPRASAWDFLNPFESYEKDYPSYTPSRDSKELREEEGIPDLEDDNEVVKEVHGNPKFVNVGKNHDHTRKGVIVEEEDEDDDDEDDEDEFHRMADSEASMYQARPSAILISNDEGNDDGAEYEVHVVDKKVVDGEGRSGQGGGGAARGSRSVAEALAEIEVQFRRASECGNEVARLLEVGNLPYNRKHRGIILPVVY